MFIYIIVFVTGRIQAQNCEDTQKKQNRFELFWGAIMLKVVKKQNKFIMSHAPNELV